jgi:AraC-like DNA-binding protein
MTQALRSSSGIAGYDQARWSAWVPELSHVRSADGLSSLYQRTPASACDSNLLEVPGSASTMLVFWTQGQPVEAGLDGPRRLTRHRPWSFSLIPAHCPSSWISSRDSSDGAFHLHLGAGLVGDISQEEGIPFAPAPELSAYDPLVAQTAQWLLQELDSGVTPSRLLWHTAGQTLGLRLLRLVGKRARTHASGGLAAWQERRTTEFLVAHLAEDITLDALAAIVDLSTFHFARAFKASTGLPPHAYLRRLRCERAKTLLTDSRLSVGEIAAEVGYDTPQAFARMFRAEVGASPSEWRRDLMR